MHAALGDGHARGVGRHRHLEGDLGAVGEGGDHVRLLAPLLGEALLRGRVAVGVLQPLDVAEQHRADPDALDEAVKVADDARLVAVDVGEDHAGAVGLGLEERPERAVELGVHQQGVLAVLDAGEHRAGGLLDRAGHLEQHVDMRARRHQHRILGDRAPPRLDGAGECGRAVADRRVLLAGLGVGGDRLGKRAVGDGDDADGVAVRQAHLQRHARGHEAGADHADPDRRPALGHVAGEGGVDDDHELSFPLPRPAFPAGSPGIRIASPH